MGFLRTDRDHADFEAETQPDQALSLQVLAAVMMVMMVVVMMVFSFQYDNQYDKPSL